MSARAYLTTSLLVVRKLRWEIGKVNPVNCRASEWPILALYKYIALRFGRNLPGEASESVLGMFVRLQGERGPHCDSFSGSCPYSQRNVTSVLARTRWSNTLYTLLRQATLSPMSVTESRVRILLSPGLFILQSLFIKGFFGTYPVSHQT